jgi:CheY-like chemotaxis protein
MDLYDAICRLLQVVAPASPLDGQHAPLQAEGVIPLDILLAEDNPVNQRVAVGLLTRRGHRVTVSTNGLEALAALEAKSFDVVLMDVQMPELDGLDATRRICERWPPETRPRIVALTANALVEDREACFAAGMDDYVAKPIRPEALAEALRQVRPPVEPATGDNGPESSESALVLEAAALDSLRELGGDDFLAEVIDAFQADAPDLMASLRRSLNHGDTDELRRSAHTLKSNGATLGAERFAELCRDLEARAKNDDLGAAPELVDEIATEYERLGEALAELRTRAPS